MYTLYFRDSQVASVRKDGEDLRIFLSSAAVACGKPTGQGGVDGYLAPVELCMKQVTLSGEYELCTGRLSAGELRLRGTQGVTILRSLALPFACMGPVSLRLEFAQGSVLELSGASLKIALTGGERYTESYAC